MTDKPKLQKSLRHVALTIKNFESCIYFYTKLLDMEIVWKPDADNIYLSSGDDNLALHRATAEYNPAAYQHLDHLGFFLKERQEVDQWHDYLRAHNVVITTAPKDHRDGTRSFYCADPDGNIIQMIYYPINSPGTRVE